MTYVPLAQITLTAPDAEIVFGNIPNSFRDLVLVVDGTTSSVANFELQFNGDTGNNYSWVAASGTGSQALSFAASAVNTARVTYYGYLEPATRGNIIAQIMDYTATDKQKTILGRANNVANGTNMGAARWANMNAITSIRCFFQDGTATLSSGSSITLYGIAG